LIEPAASISRVRVKEIKEIRVTKKEKQKKGG